MKQELGKIIGVGANAEVFEYGPGKVVKLFRSQAHASGIHSEHRQTLAAWQNGLPVPQPFEIVEIDGRPGLVFEQIVGDPLAGWMLGDGRWEMMKLLARLQHQVHTVPQDKVAATGFPPVKAGLSWLIYSQPLLTGEIKRIAMRTLVELPDGNRMLHGDLHMLNVIMRGNSPVIIDWQGSSIGSPAYDVMQLLLILRYAAVPPGMLPQEYVDSFYANRLEMEQVFLDEYCALSSITRQEIEAWFLPCAVGRLFPGILEEERDALLAAIYKSIGEHNKQ